jgi:hypothetical protein
VLSLITLEPRNSKFFCLVTAPDPSWTLTSTAAERTCITGNICHVITTYCCVTSPRTRKTQLRLLLRVGTCLESCCLATRWSNPLQCEHDEGNEKLRKKFPIKFQNCFPLELINHTLRDLYVTDCVYTFVLPIKWWVISCQMYHIICLSESYQLIVL